MLNNKASYSIADHQREWIFKWVNEPLELPERNSDPVEKRISKRETMRLKGLCHTLDTLGWCI